MEKLLAKDYFLLVDYIDDDTVLVRDMETQKLVEARIEITLDPDVTELYGRIRVHDKYYYLDDENQMEIDAYQYDDEYDEPSYAHKVLLGYTNGDD